MTPARTLLRVPRGLVAAILVAAVLVLGLLTLTTPVGAEDAPPSATELRARRATLLRRIAVLTDKVEDARRDAVNARARQALTGLTLEEARRDFADLAVRTFVDATDDPQTAQLRRQAWNDAIHAAQRTKLLDLRRVQGELESQQSTADDALAEATRLKAELEEARQTLESTIAERDAADRAARRARGEDETTPRAVPATRGQSVLMGRFPFGPVTGIPAGLVATGQVLDGMASWYGPGFDGHRTASGAIFDQEAFTVASRTLPLGTVLLLTRGDRQVLVLVNDRGPYVGGRILDLAHGVAVALGTVSSGVARVSAQILAPAG